MSSLRTVSLGGCRAIVGVRCCGSEVSGHCLRFFNLFCLMRDFSRKFFLHLLEVRKEMRVLDIDHVFEIFIDKDGVRQGSGTQGRDRDIIEERCGGLATSPRDRREG